MLETAFPHDPSRSHGPPCRALQTHTLSAHEHGVGLLEYNESLQTAVTAGLPPVGTVKASESTGLPLCLGRAAAVAFA